MPRAVARRSRSLRPAFFVGIAGLQLATAFVGALVAMRHPRNPIGRLFLVFAQGFPIGVASNTYGALDLPGAAVAGPINGGS